ncbi:MAG: Mini-ribonuclease 3 [Clostridia bacterium]|nr:Mini-ribonuclease 3 [Clostridia bacterium]
MLTGGENLTKTQVLQISPITLAFLGDAAYSLYVRERLVKAATGKVADFQRVASKILSAKGQSAFLERVEPLFTEEEADVFRRAKNAKKATKAKSASSLEYNRSTGFEAVLGYLYLLGETGRMDELLSVLNDEDFKIEETRRAFKPCR